MLKNLLLLSALICFSFSQGSAANPEKIQSSPQIVVEPDQTDIFAIPLDEDAQDQQEELYQLEHPKQK